MATEEREGNGRGLGRVGGQFVKGRRGTKTRELRKQYN